MLLTAISLSFVIKRIKTAGVDEMSRQEQLLEPFVACVTRYRSDILGKQGALVTVLPAISYTPDPIILKAATIAFLA